MSKIQFSEKAWADCLYGQAQDKKTLKRINALIRHIQRGPFGETGKPEPLKGSLSGYGSRRIDETDRIVYQQEDGVIPGHPCLGHYQ